jgi:K+-transporting ATPase KdpF subunit
MDPMTLLSLLVVLGLVVYLGFALLAPERF